jgi:hypothetical protein
VEPFAELMEPFDLRAIGVIATVCGAVTALLATCAVCATRPKLPACMVPFALALALVVLAQLAVCAQVLRLRTNGIDGMMRDAFFDPARQDTLLRVQESLSCCGYEVAAPSRDNAGTVDCAQAFTTPCRDAILSHLDETFVPLAALVVLLCVLELSVVAAACNVRCNRRADELEDEQFKLDGVDV